MAIPVGADLATVSIDDADGSPLNFVALVNSLPLPLTRTFQDQPRAADDWQRRLEGRLDGGSLTIPLAFNDAAESAAGFRALAASQMEQTFNTTRSVTVGIGTRTRTFEAVIASNFFGIPQDEYMTNPVTLDVDGPVAES